MSNYIDILSGIASLNLKEVATYLSRELNESKEELAERLNQVALISQKEDYSVERLNAAQFDLSRVPHDMSRVQIEIPEALEKQGVAVYSISEAKKAVPERFSQWEKKYQDKFHTSLDAFHRAFYSQAVVLHIPKNIESDEAICIDQFISGDAVHYMIILVEENVHLAIDETLKSQADTVLSAHLNTFIDLGAHSRIDYHGLDLLAESTTALIRRWGLVGQESNLQWTLAALNGGHVIEDSHVDLVGNGGESDLRIAGISTLSQVQVVNSLVTNIASNTRGFIAQRGVILDSSTLTFNGIGWVVKGAKWADCDQESRVLMLSDDARGDTNPILLIDEFEVVAGHAASIGRINEEDLFYLMSRGISRKTAETLFIRGFLLSQISQSLGHDKTEMWLDEFLRKLRHI